MTRKNKVKRRTNLASHERDYGSRELSLCED